MHSSYDILIEKLDGFIRKYHQNQLIRGGIYTFSLVLVFFLFVAGVEYFGEFNTTIRTFLFYSFLLSTIFVFAKLVVIPSARMLNYGERISNEQAAEIIGKHFSNVSDKLLNILQLNQALTSQKSELLLAGIDQKAIELKPIPFATAIDLSENKKYLKYAIPPLLVLLLILMLYPKLITQSAERLVKHQTYFEKTAPFKFSITNEELVALQNEDFELTVDVSGDEIPNEVYVELDDNRFRLKKSGKTSFSYLFKNIQKETSFKLSAGGFFSIPYSIKLIKKPSLLKFSTNIKYPKYVGKKDEILQNKGDLTIPEGTEINWNFITENVTNLSVIFPDTTMPIHHAGEKEFQFELLPKNSTSYRVLLSNNDIQNQQEDISYIINVLKDEYPKIEVKQQSDSLLNKRIYFKGNTRDDYGLTKLTFNYKHKDSADYSVENLMVSPFFYHYWDISNITLKAGDEIDYFFEVWDNDGYNGRKSTKSAKYTFKAPTLDELEAKAEKTNEVIKSDMEDSIEEAKKIQEELEKMKRKLADKKELDWEDRQKLKELIDQQKQLEQKVEDIKTENAKKNVEQNEYKNTDEKILEKQKQIEELFEKVMTDEMKKMFEELEKLLDNANKEQLQKMMEDMELSNEDIEKELDRTLELFKQLEFEQKMEETINKLEELAKKQEELAEETKEGKSPQEELQKKQEELSKEFEKAKEDLEDLKQKNEELEQPNTMPKTEQQQQNIENEMQESSENLENNKNKKASENQKNAAEQMQQMAQQMQQAMDQMQQEANQEDIDDLRQLLENLVQLSFDQEALMNEVKTINNHSPYFVNLIKQQKKLADDTKMVEDSLFALSKRNPQIEPDVNREINKINQHIEKTLELLTDHQPSKPFRQYINEASVQQQYTMTSFNNLALMLDEVVQQMQQQMSQKQFGESSCSKPGGKPGPKKGKGSMKSMQQQISKQIDELKKGMKPGEQGMGKSGGTMSKELAKLAAEQEALRQQIQELANQMGDEGNKSGKGNLDKLSELMEENERDLVNKQITQETIRRQEEIMSRLLEHENAEREREFDNKREAKEAKNTNFSNPSDFFEYNKLKQQEEELLRTVAPELSPFYKKKVNSYFQNIKE